MSGEDIVILQVVLSALALCGAAYLGPTMLAPTIVILGALWLSILLGAR